MKVKIEEIIIDKELYPRIEPTESRINQYRQAIEKLPPIVISKNKKLIDGYHRLMAQKLEKNEEIEVEVLDIEDDREIFFESVRRNATSGIQLSLKEKKLITRKLYQQFKLRQQEIADMISVSQMSVSNYLKDLIDKDKEETKRIIFDKYMKCFTYEQIKEELAKKDIELEIARISEIVRDDYIFKKFFKNIIEDPEYSNNWKTFKLDEEQLKYDGNLPKELVENIIYYFTEPRDIVIDPMAGSGIVGEVCKEMGRRYKLFDKSSFDPIKGIEENNVLESIPKLKINELANCIFLDPPYGPLLKEKYGENEFTKDYKSFLEAMKKTVTSCRESLKIGGKLVLLMKPMREGLYEGEWYPQSQDCSNILRANGFKIIQEISAPLSFHNQFSPSQVAEAKEKKVLLNIVNHILVFEKVK